MAKPQYVIKKNGKYGTEAGGLGSKPKLYSSQKAATADIASNAKLRDAEVVPYDVASGNGDAAGTKKARTKKAAARK
jgi:hypothetical protein